MGLGFREFRVSASQLDHRLRVLGRFRGQGVALLRKVILATISQVLGFWVCLFFARLHSLGFKELFFVWFDRLS